MNNLREITNIIMIIGLFLNFSDGSISILVTGLEIVNNALISGNCISNLKAKNVLKYCFKLLGVS